jgi:cobalt-zinc-cadmium efflux system membrane fusion protein
MNTIRIASVLGALLSSALLVACGRDAPSGETGGAHAAPAEEFERGPHRGRMLRDGDFALELQIFEDGVPPEYHVYLFRNDEPLPPTAAQVRVELERLDGETNRFEFRPERDFLRGDGVVTEPHSFSVTVTATEGGRTHRWEFDSFEGRVTIAAAQATDAGIRAEAAGGATIKDTLTLSGRLMPNAERVRSVSARFPGAIRRVEKSVGDSVRVGDRLATIESNESLELYAVNAPIAGVIIERHANAGENAGAEPLFVIADYSGLWAELNLFPRDLPRVKVGQTVLLKSVEGEVLGEGKISRIAPVEAARHAGVSGIYNARVLLANPGQRWVPGLFVEGAVHIGAAAVPLAVKRSGLQTFRDFTVVFAQVGETYEVRMLELGRQDDTWVEVLGGLKPGTSYVVENSYLIKADIEKSGASHDH